MLPDPRNTIDDHRSSTGILIVDCTTIRLLEGIILMIQYGADTQRRDRKIDLPMDDFRLDDPVTMIFTTGTYHGRDIQIEGLIMT